MKNYKFLYDKQNGQYLGLTRELDIENSTDIEPFFQSGFVTVFKSGEWSLVGKEFYFDEMARRDLLREFCDVNKDIRVELIARIDEHERYLINRLFLIESELSRRHELILDKINTDYFGVCDRISELDRSVWDAHHWINNTMVTEFMHLKQSLIVERFKRFFVKMIEFFGVKR